MEENNQTPQVSESTQIAPITQSIHQDSSISKPKSKLPLIIIAIILFLLFTGSVAGFYVFRQNSLEMTPESTATRTVQKTIPTPDPTTDWKTYQSPKLNFVFRFPAEYSITKNVDGPNPGANDILNHNITWRLENREALENCRGGGCRYYTDSTVIQLGNNKVTKVTGLVGTIGGNIPENYIDYHITQLGASDDVIFRIKELPSDKSYQDLLKQYPANRSVQEISPTEINTLEKILSTFKFTDSQTLDTSNWKTYSNSTYRYSLHIPPGWIVDTDNAIKNNDAMVFIHSNDFKVFADSQVPHLSSGVQLVVQSKFSSDVTKSYSDFISSVKPDKTLYPDDGKQITVDGEKAMLWTSEQAYGIPGQRGYLVGVFLDGQGYLIEMTSATHQDILLNQILSVFKFIK